MQEKGHNIILQIRHNFILCAKGKIDPVKHCNTGQYFVSSLPKCAEMVNLYIYKYIAIENIHTLYGNTSSHTPRNVIHDGSLANTLTFTHLDGRAGWVLSQRQQGFKL
jgi:hypothetical protein